jgi:superfamily II DNA or RNA helicase
MQKKQRPSPLRLHEYQKDAKYKVKSHLRDQRSTLLAHATGCGKTITALSWASDEMGKGDRLLWIAHRRELIYQPVERIRQFFPKLHPAMADVVIATVQSLNSGSRLNDILAYGPITHLVTDEAHHARADTYERVYARLFEANPDMRHLGVTATPRRADDLRLSDIFESVADRLPLSKAIKIGALVPFVAKGFYVERVSIGHLSQAGEDWSDKAVGEVMTERAVLDTAVEKWKEHAAGRPTIAFCATVAQAQRMANWFQKAGTPAASANYMTPKKERAAILRLFERGDLQVICNAMLWTEGVDLPMAEVALMLRPTRSDSLYVQMAGRILRTHPGKQHALILDLVPADARNMIMAGDLLDGVPKKQKKLEEKAEDKGILLSCFGVDKDGQGIDGDPDEVVMKVLSYLTQSTLAWTMGEIATVGLSDTKTLAVVLPDSARVAEAERHIGTDRWNADCQREYDRISKYRVYAIEQTKDPHTGKKGGRNARYLGTFDSWAELVPLTEDYAAEHQDSVLAKRKKRWRNQPPSDKQVAFANRLRIPDVGGMTKGQLAQAITHKLTLDLLKRKRLTL